jgi:hypothetical protein
MARTPSYDDLQRQIQEVIQRLDAKIQTTSFEPGRLDDSELFAEALGATLTAFSTSLGECRRETPFSALHPVIDHEGNFKWCCNHDPEHCAG